MTKKSIYLLQNTDELNDELRRKFVACGYEVLGQSIDGSRAIEEIKEKRPNYVILELVLQNTDG